MTKASPLAVRQKRPSHAQVQSDAYVAIYGGIASFKKRPDPQCPASRAQNSPQRPDPQTHGAGIGASLYTMHVTLGTIV